MSIANPSSFALLRQFLRQRADQERCELCAATLQEDHQHLIEIDTRRLVCSCDACSLLFDGKAGTHYRRVPRRIEFLADFQMTDALWENLLLHINLAFFYYSTSAKRVVAMFPSPAGATESLLTLETWSELSTANPILKEFEPDVEALLVNRIGQSREYCRVPIDQCYRLVGLIRTHWRGLSGGTEVWKHFTAFFNELKAKSATKVPDHA